MRRLSITGAVLVSGLTLTVAGCRGREAATRGGAAGAATSPGPLAEPVGPADPAVASTVERVLESARHPGLRWPDLTDVAPALRDLYSGEADRLFWFAGERS